MTVVSSVAPMRSLGIKLGIWVCHPGFADSVESSAEGVDLTASVAVKTAENATVLRNTEGLAINRSNTSPVATRISWFGTWFNAASSSSKWFRDF